ncbi:MAG: DUF4279 domain-containing protein [Prevotellaceae bacterium]|jgi:hypothetical protein|nr:DUF4279 domain-containing protein [Prevotellaceae bacterium]
MERKKNLYKIAGSFGFNTDDKDSIIVTQKLGIQPHWNWNKGDEHFIKRINKTYYRPFGIWGYSAKPIFMDVTDISLMVQGLRELLSDKIEIINELVNEYNFEFNIRITIYTEEEGACGTSISKEDLEFLSKTSGRFDISYLTVENVEDPLLGASLAE